MSAFSKYTWVFLKKCYCIKTLIYIADWIGNFTENNVSTKKNIPLEEIVVFKEALKM